MILFGGFRLYNRLAALRKHACMSAAVLTLCLSGYVLPGRAQPLTVPEGFQHLTTKHGLSDPSVGAILCDRYGFIWIGTSDGLNRFDGVDMHVFRHVKGDSTSLSGNWVRMLFEDSRGNIWIGLQDHSLSCYDRQRATFRNFFPIKKEGGGSEGNRIVTAMCEDRSGRLWRADFSGEISFYDPLRNKFIYTAGKKGAAGNRPLEFIRTLARDSLGRMWAGSFKHGLFFLDTLQQLWESYPWKDTSLAGNTIKEILVAHDGMIWVATWGGGLKRIHPVSGTIEVFRARTGAGAGPLELTNDFILSLAEDRHGRIWIGFPGNGLDIFDPSTGSWTHHHHLPNDRTSLNNDIVTVLTCASDNTMWIGTDAGGVSYLSPYRKQFHYLPTPGIHGNGPQGVPVQATLVDSHGDLWIGTASEGIMRMPHGSDSAVTYMTGNNGHASLRDNSVTAITEDHREILWVGKMNGLSRFDREHDRFAEVDVALSGEHENPYITSICEGSDGILWFSTYGQGIIALDPLTGQKRHLRHDARDTTSLGRDFFYALARAGLRDLWLGSYMGGLQQLNVISGRATRFTGSAAGLSLGILTVQSLLVDDRSRLWLGTRGDGVVVMDTLGNFIAHYGEGSGLPGDHIGGIAQDSHGNLWIGTPHGISRFDPVRKLFRTFDEHDGLPAMSIGNVSQRNGWLFFGGAEGLVWFHPDSIHEAPGNTPIAITEVKVLDRSLAPDHPFTQSAPLSLDYSQNDLTFEYTALNYYAPAKAQYEYRLDGLDVRWRSNGTRRDVHFTNLDPGTYVLRVRGVDGDGAGGGPEATVLFHIAPPFWYTWWFLFLAGGILVVSVVLLVRWRFARLKRVAAFQESLTRQILASQDQDRKRIGSSLHDGLGQNLLLIKNLATLTLSKGSVDAEKLPHVEEISSLATHAIGEVREIAYDLHPYQLDRLGLTGALQSMCTRMAGSTSTHFSVELDNVDGLIPKDQEIHVYRIAQECVNNCVRHAKAAHVVVRLVRKGKHVVLTVQDDGAGYTAGVEGFGISGLRERVKILRGTITIDTAPGKGTTVRVEFPLEDHP
jgi:signal transduction histidine kinase/ligand-binding sensor domain-containing protein